MSVCCGDQPRRWPHSTAWAAKAVSVTCTLDAGLEYSLYQLLRTELGASGQSANTALLFEDQSAGMESQFGVVGSPLNRSAIHCMLRSPST